MAVVVAKATLLPALGQTVQLGLNLAGTVLGGRMRGGGLFGSGTITVVVLLRVTVCTHAVACTWGMDIRMPRPASADLNIATIIATAGMREWTSPGHVNTIFYEITNKGHLIGPLPN